LPAPAPRPISLCTPKEKLKEKCAPGEPLLRGFSAAAKLARRALRAQDGLRTGAADYPEKPLSRSRLKGVANTAPLKEWSKVFDFNVVDVNAIDVGVPLRPSMRELFFGAVGLGCPKPILGA